jgi:TonB family protein
MRFALGLLVAACAINACAQTISGRVYDQTAAIVSGARVVLLQDFDKIAETTANEAGEFSFRDLKPGEYQVQVKQPYFSIFQQLVRLEERRHARVHAVLHVARANTEMGIGAAAPGEARPAAAVKAFRAGGRVQGIKRLSGRMPAFPEKAAARGAHGPVVLYGTVTAEGDVAKIVVLESPDHELEEAAVEAWKTWKYQPMKLNGQPVECRELFVFQFHYR